MAQCVDGIVPEHRERRPERGSGASGGKNREGGNKDCRVDILQIERLACRPARDGGKSASQRPPTTPSATGNAAPGGEMTGTRDGATGSPRATRMPISFVRSATPYDDERRKYQRHAKASVTTPMPLKWHSQCVARACGNRNLRAADGRLESRAGRGSPLPAESAAADRRWSWRGRPGRRVKSLTASALHTAPRHRWR